MKERSVLVVEIDQSVTVGHQVVLRLRSACVDCADDLIKLEKDRRCRKSVVEDGIVPGVNSNTIATHVVCAY